MPSILDRLMQEAGSLAKQIQRERYACAASGQGWPELRALEAQVLRTWTAIRLARSSSDAAWADLQRQPEPRFAKPRPPKQATSVPTELPAPEIPLHSWVAAVSPRTQPAQE
ncbi:MAG: hypothetical protein ACR2PL_14375 [Dehalococcoidia bacterium]